MSVESVKTFFAEKNQEELVLYSETVSDTVEHAAEVLGCESRQIAKTMSFLVDDEHHTVKVTLPQLETYSGNSQWVDVCKNWKDLRRRPQAILV